MLDIFLDRPSLMIAIMIPIFGLLVLISLAAKLAQPKFYKRKILNASESKLYRVLNDLAPEGWILSMQTSYGSMLGCKSKKKYWTINARRTDFSFCDADFQPIAVIEYQGSGHYGRGRKSRARALEGDAKKKAACEEAGIAFMEIPAKYNREIVRKKLLDAQAMYQETLLSNQSDV